jgi:8-oxo-dGTP pyrophosphatase MutT (NUDIX family)
MSAGLQPPEPWFRPEPQLAAALVREAREEIGADHELVGHKLTAVVKCAGCDEVIFSVDDGTFALVHLTWAQHPEPPPWPATTRLGGLIALDTVIDNHQH